MLADLGADVVKLEPPEGDIIRFAAPAGRRRSRSASTSPGRTPGSARSRVDLRTARGAALVRAAGRVERRGAGELPPRRRSRSSASTPTRCWRAQPELVYCSINGWGFDNSWSQRRAYAAMVQAEVGRVELDARLRNAPPEQSPHVDGDITPGLLAVSGDPRRAVPARAHRASASTSTSRWPRRSCTPTNGRRPSSPGTTGPRIPDTWNYPIFTRRRRHRRRRSWAIRTGGSPEIAAALTDDAGRPTRTRATRRCRSSPTSARRCPTSPRSRRASSSSGSSSPRCGTVQQLAETPWAHERDVFAEVEPGARVAAAPFRSDGATIGVRGPGTALRRAHPRRARRALRAERGRPRPARGRGDHQVRLSGRAQAQPYRLASIQPRTGSGHPDTRASTRMRQ